MAISQADIQYAFYMLDQAIYTDGKLNARDCALLKTFIEALLEQRSESPDQTKSREWRAGVYRKFLDDPEALEQFTMQAIKKFGPENLAQMVVPELQVIIVNNHIQEMSPSDLYHLLKSHDRLGDLVDYAMNVEEEWVKERLRIQDKIDEAYDNGRSEGYEEGKVDGINEANENRRYRRR